MIRRPSAGQLLAMGVGVVLAVGGCAARVGPVDSELEGENAVGMPAVTTDLLSAGTAPRLRLDRPAPPGAQQRIVLTVHRDMRQQVDDQPVEHFITPDITMTLDATANRGGVDVILGAVTANGAQQATELTGSHAIVITDNVGAVTGFRLVDRSGTENDAEARALVEHALYQAILQQLVFPGASIGPGAVWLVHRRIPGRPRIDQTTRARVVEVSGGLLRVEVQVDQHPSAGTGIGADMMTPTADSPIHGSGTVVVDRGLPLPTQAAVTIDGDRLYHAPSGGLRLRQTTDVHVSWGPPS